MTDAGFIAWMSRPGPPDMVDGEIVMRTMAQLWERYTYVRNLERLGQAYTLTTRHGKRHYYCTVVAVYEGPDPMNGNA